MCVCACICLYVYTHAVFPKSVLETTWSCPLLHSMHFTLESKTLLMCYAVLHGNLSPMLYFTCIFTRDPVLTIYAFLHGNLNPAPYIFAWESKPCAHCLYILHWHLSPVLTSTHFYTGT